MRIYCSTCRTSFSIPAEVSSVPESCRRCGSELVVASLRSVAPTLPPDSRIDPGLPLIEDRIGSVSIVLRDPLTLSDLTAFPEGTVAPTSVEGWAAIDWCVEMEEGLRVLSTFELWIAIASGQIDQERRVWRKGMYSWHRIETVPELVCAIDGAHLKESFLDENREGDWSPLATAAPPTFDFRRGATRPEFGREREDAEVAAFHAALNALLGNTDQDAPDAKDQLAG